MTWNPYYTGDGVPRDVEIADPPPWRTFPRAETARCFQPPEGLIHAVNAALALRRPLLVTGPAGSGKSTVIEQVAAELKLGRVLRRHVTSREVLADALYRYDAPGHVHARRLHRSDDVDDIASFLPQPTVRMLRQVVGAHLGADVAADSEVGTLITDFVTRVSGGDRLAVDQLLNAVHLVSGRTAPEGEQRLQVIQLLMRELSRA